MEIEKLCNGEYVSNKYDRKNEKYIKLREKLPYEDAELFNEVIEDIFRAGFKSGINFALEVIDRNK